MSTWSAFSARLVSQTGMAFLVGYAFVKSDEGQDLPSLVLPNRVVALAVLAGVTQVLRGELLLLCNKFLDWS